jgi:hypothetical protein
MNMQSLWMHLEQWMQEEIVGKRRLADLITEQESALLANRIDDLDRATHSVDTELARELERSKRRQRIFVLLAKHWEVDAAALTLGSIVERGGRDAEAIGRLREELRDAAASVLKKNRRFARFAHAHSRLVQDTLALVLHGDENALLRDSGSVFDARA